MAHRVVKRLTSIRVLLVTLLVISTIGAAGIGLWMFIGTGLHYHFASSLSVWLLTLRQY